MFLHVSITPKFLVLTFTKTLPILGHGCNKKNSTSRPHTMLFQHEGAQDTLTESLTDRCASLISNCVLSSQYIVPLDFKGLQQRSACWKFGELITKALNVEWYIGPNKSFQAQKLLQNKYKSLKKHIEEWITRVEHLSVIVLHSSLLAVSVFCHIRCQTPSWWKTFQQTVIQKLSSLR